MTSGTRAFGLLATGWVTTLVAGCGGSGDYAGAATTAAAGAIGAGVYRATTGGCYGQCLNGLVCDRQSGTCVAPSPCGGRCSASEVCEQGTIPRCVPIFERAKTRTADAGTAVAGNATAGALATPASDGGAL